MSIPFVEKYRPKSFDEVEGNQEVIACLKAIQESRVIPNMLFYGPPGTGKTTSIRIISNSFPNTSVLELNASDERGISVVRETIKEFASTYSNTIKLVVLDEVDFMTRDAQNALRRIMEDFSSTTRFCLIANYPKKIITPITSRCSKFRFNPVKIFRKSVLEICKKENIEVEYTGIDFLMKTSYGDMRRVVNDIQAIGKSFGIINQETVLKFNSMLSTEEFKEIFDWFLCKSYDALLRDLESIKETKSLDLANLLLLLTDHVVQSSLENKMEILKKMSDIECRLNLGCSEKLQLKGLVSIFILLRNKQKCK
ncbi:replication factor c subunit 5 [Vairimorpha ceranae]|uniref:Replication factor c subunit 5 n=1 Tax=Vairimorpha ceranae TaxID=40302 RepID=A0A0F9YQK4_9MICR|nr:replication factor c subunit 5 [Vairimorpha ceranae]KAF5139935.1 hypothetical protein G9O61_00g018550 [Vairimorpha ceranae]KKO74857.1 replication factor c subunit 5 [Vairimorpha ceranae]